MSIRQELINEIATQAKANPNKSFGSVVFDVVDNKTQSLDFIANYIAENLYILNEEIEGVDWMAPESLADYFQNLVIDDTFADAKELADSGEVPSVTEQAVEAAEKTNVRAELTDKIVAEIYTQFNDEEISEVDDVEVRQIAQEIINDISYDSLRFVADYFVESPHLLNERADEESPSLSSLYVAHFEIVMSADITNDVMGHEDIVALQEKIKNENSDTLTM